jgi:branched-chain amino acid transport system ATP-binding protein|tara:strand:- start:647 stop:1414 length:768 start_codon:yes stop_codon:yes gene_type:complete
MSDILKVENVTLQFGGVKAITDISFNVKEGEICAVIGPNGAGKSSMLNVINGVYLPQIGTVTYDGVARRTINPRDAAIAGMARTFQNIALFQGMTVLENIMTGRNLFMKSTWLEQGLNIGRAREEERSNRLAVEKIIKFLQIESIRKTPVAKLPYGLQKRVELGRALVAEPKILLLDEPMAGMNLEEKADMSCFILEINKEQGISTVMIEHDMGVVMDISDHVVVLDYGKKIGDGSPTEVMANQDVIDAYLGVSH